MSDSLSLSDLQRLLNEQQQKINFLEKRVKTAERQAEAAEQYSRQDCLILRGKLNIRSNQSFRAEVMRLIEFHTGVSFPGWCLNTTHWLGGGKSIIVRFNNKAVRDEVYRNRVPKEEGKRGLFIHESLTASKMSLVARCAALRNNGQISTYYTQGGHVLVKKSRNSPSMLITPDMTDDNIIRKVNQQPNTYREAVVKQGGEQNQLGEPSSTQRTADAEPAVTEEAEDKDRDTGKNTETTKKEDPEKASMRERDESCSQTTASSDDKSEHEEDGESQTESDTERKDTSEKTQKPTSTSHKEEGDTPQQEGKTKQQQKETKVLKKVKGASEDNKTGDKEKKQV